MQIPVTHDRRQFMVFLGPNGRTTSIRVLRYGKWRSYWAIWSTFGMRPIDRIVAAHAIRQAAWAFPTYPRMTAHKLPDATP